MSTVFQPGDRVEVIKTQERGVFIRTPDSDPHLAIIAIDRLIVGKVELLYAKAAIRKIADDQSTGCPFQPGDIIESTITHERGRFIQLWRTDPKFAVIEVKQSDGRLCESRVETAKIRKVDGQVESTIEPQSPLPPTKQQIDGDHYRKLSIDPVEYSLANDLNCLQFSIVKHATRYPHKGEAITDLKKVIHYAQIALERQYSVLSQISYQEPT